MTILANDKYFTVPDYMEVRDNMLYNKNTKKYEAVEGDVITITDTYEKYGDFVERDIYERQGTVKGYTNYQIIPTKEWPTIVLSANRLANGETKIKITHKTCIQKVND
jgi:hypothetical protein